MLVKSSRQRGFTGDVDQSGNTVFEDEDRNYRYYPSGVYPTYKVLEATDASEYAALSDANKDAYKMILSCGEVDLSDGTAVRTKLLAMFGAGTTTRTNLVALVS